MTEEQEPKVPLFASRATPPLGSENGMANSRGKQRLSVSLMLLSAIAVIGGGIILWGGFYAETENIEISLETISRTPTTQLQLTGLNIQVLQLQG